MTAHSVVVYHKGPSWSPDATLQQQDHAFGHVRFIRQIISDGRARLAGPCTRLDERAAHDVIGMIVFDLPVDEALAAVADDPAVKHELLVLRAYTFYPV